MIKIQKIFYITMLLLIFNQISYAKPSPRLDSLEKSNVELQKELDNSNKELFKQDLDIKNLQKSIDELKNELQKQKDKQENYKIDKNSYDLKLKSKDNIISRQDARIEDISYYSMFWGALITFLIIIIAWSSRRESVLAAKDALDKWIDESADEILNKKADNLLDTKIEEYFKQKNIEAYIEDKLLKQMDEKLKLAKAYLDDIQSKADRHLDTIEEAKEKAKESLASVEFIYKEAKNITKESIVKIEEKETKDLTFDDYYNLGLDAIQKKNFNVANIQFEKALEKANSSEEKEKAYFMIGYSLSTQKEYSKAIEAYKKSVDINSKNDEAYHNMGIAYCHIEKFDEAIDAYTKAIQINPNQSEAYANLFELQLTLNKPFNEELEEENIKRFSNQKENFIQYEMLKILQSIANNQEVNIDEWKEKYKDVSLGGWVFDELDAWVEKMEDSEVKNRLIEALEVFKGHKN